MNRTAAVERIQEGLGFQSIQSTLIVSRLQEAQRDLEKGKTLPRFLLQETQPLVVGAGVTSVALPTGFLRPASKLRYVSATDQRPTFLPWHTSYELAYGAYYTEEAGKPRVAVLRNSTIDFINTTDIAYTFYWDYYKAAELLTSDIENEWLADGGGSLWLMGEAGFALAQDKRDPSAIAVFDKMRTRGRAATFGDDLAYEDSVGPTYMGSEL